MLKERAFYSWVSFLGKPLSLLILLILVPEISWAHETWILTPQQIVAWDAQPLPRIFTHLGVMNVSLVIITLLFIVGWLKLDKTGAKELFPELQATLSANSPCIPLILRICLAIMLLMAAVELEPIPGQGYLAEPVFAAPDLKFSLLSPYWHWLNTFQFVLGVLLLLGIYPRLMAVIFLLFSILGFILFKHAMFAYLGLMLGSGIYLLLQGGGLFQLPMPKLLELPKLTQWLESQPRARAQYILRILSGLNFLYLGVYYKVLHPNLALAIVELYHVPTFGMSPETFVFVMAIVETFAGLTILAGVLLRPLSIFLMAAFIFFATLLDENPIGHIMFYGVIAAFFIDSAGRWSRPIAKDKPAKIVILGGGTTGVHSARKLEALLGAYSNVEVTLIHWNNTSLFNLLLPEVIAGTVQPSSIANSIREICPKTKFIQGQVTTINYQQSEVELIDLNGNVQIVPYTQLLLTLPKEITYQKLGFSTHSLPITTIGEALILRQKILMQVEKLYAKADFTAEKITIVIIGGGLLGCAIAAEISNLLRLVLHNFQHLTAANFQLLLIEKQGRLIANYEATASQKVQHKLEKRRVTVLLNSEVDSITDQKVVLSSRREIAAQVIVNTLLDYPSVIKPLYSQNDSCITINNYLQATPADNVYVAGSCTHLAGEYPLFFSKEIRLGSYAAYNAWAASQGYKLRKWKETRPWFYLINLGKRSSVGSLAGLPLPSILVWWLSRSLHLLSLPSFEKNLRVFIDWVMDIFFSNDVVTYALEQPSKVQFVSYSKQFLSWGLNEDSGDKVMFVLEGKVKVVNEVPVSQLEAGDYLALKEAKQGLEFLAETQALIMPEKLFLPLYTKYAVNGKVFLRDLFFKQFLLYKYGFFA